MRARPKQKSTVVLAWALLAMLAMSFAGCTDAFDDDPTRHTVARALQRERQGRAAKPEDLPLLVSRFRSDQASFRDALRESERRDGGGSLAKLTRSDSYLSELDCMRSATEELSELQDQIQSHDSREWDGFWNKERRHVRDSLVDVCAQVWNPLAVFEAGKRDDFRLAAETSLTIACTDLLLTAIEARRSRGPDSDALATATEARREKCQANYDKLKAKPAP